MLIFEIKQLKYTLDENMKNTKKISSIDPHLYAINKSQKILKSKPNEIYFSSFQRKHIQ